MNVLVTGGAGFVGCVLVQHLLDSGHRVRVLDDLWFGGEQLLAPMSRPRFEFYRGDIRRDELLPRCLADIEAVVHLAAVVGEPHCARRPQLALDVNQCATFSLLEECRRRRIVRFVFASTCSGYGVARNTDQLVTEEASLNPRGIYAQTKVAAEQQLLSRSENVSVTVLRFATLYGLSPRMRFDLIVNEFTAQVLTQRRLEVFGEGAWRPYLHVHDAARAIGAVLEAPVDAVRGRVFNVGDSDEQYTKRDLVDLIIREVGYEVDVRRNAADSDDRTYRVDFQLFRSELGFITGRTVRDGVAEICSAIRSGVFGDIGHSKYRNHACTHQ